MSTKPHLLQGVKDDTKNGKLQGNDPLPFFLDKHGPLALLQRIAGLCNPIPTEFMVTSRFWGKLMGELESFPPEAFMDPSIRPSRATVGDRFRIMSLTVINAGHDNVGICDRFNEAEARKSDWDQKYRALAIRASEKKPVMEAVDAESTHAVDC